jgi:hypothetical protein
MFARSILIFFIGMNSFMTSFAPGNAHTVSISQASWRSSWALFLEEFLNSKIQVPRATEEAMETGKRESNDSDAMKRFGGEVLFEGTFRAITTEEVMQGMTKKIDINLPRPSSLQDKGDVGWIVHIYPKSGSIQTWESLKPGAKVSFRALVKGISGMSPLANTFVYSILLEEAEIVSK